MITTFNGEGDLYALADGTLLTWERITGDATSMAIAFVHSEADPDDPEADPVLWISPGGWQPVSPMQAGITYPAIALGTLAEIMAADPETTAEVIRQAREARDVIDAMMAPEPEADELGDAEYLRSMMQPPEPVPLMTFPGEFSGGTYPRDHALTCAVQWLAGRVDISAHGVTEAASVFADWLTGTTPDPGEPA